MDKWKRKMLWWPQMGKRSYFEWSVIQFSSWGLIQPLDLETLYLKRRSEHKECIKLLWTSGWTSVKRLFYLICGNILTPNGSNKDIPVLVMSLLCAGPHSACASHSLCPQHSGVGPPVELLWLWHCGNGKGPPASPFRSFTCTSERWKLTFHWVTLHQPPRLEQLAFTHPSVLSSCSWIWNVRGKWAGRSEIWVLGECKGCLKVAIPL